MRKSNNIEKKEEKKRNRILAVIDTNVLVSSFININSIPGIIIKYAINGTITPVLNNIIINEYKDVLYRNKFGFSKYEVNSVLNNIMNNAIFLDRTESSKHVLDHENTMIYQILLTSQIIKVSQLDADKEKLFPYKKIVVTPKEMLKIIKEQDKQLIKTDN